MENPLIQIAESLTTPLKETAERLLSSGTDIEVIEGTDFFLTKEKREGQAIVGTFKHEDSIFFVVVQEK